MRGKSGPAHIVTLCNIVNQTLTHPVFSVFTSARKLPDREPAETNQCHPDLVQPADQ